MCAQGGLCAPRARCTVHLQRVHQIGLTVTPSQALEESTGRRSCTTPPPPSPKNCTIKSAIQSITLALVPSIPSHTCGCSNHTPIPPSEGAAGGSTGAWSRLTVKSPRRTRAPPPRPSPQWNTAHCPRARQQMHTKSQHALPASAQSPHPNPRSDPGHTATNERGRRHATRHSTSASSSNGKALECGLTRAAESASDANSPRRAGDWGDCGDFGLCARASCGGDAARGTPSRRFSVNGCQRGCQLGLSWASAGVVAGLGGCTRRCQRVSFGPGCFLIQKKKLECPVPRIFHL